MKSSSEAKIIDITKDARYERYLYRCLAPMPFRKYRTRWEYLEVAIPKGFHKKLLNAVMSPANSPHFSNSGPQEFVLVYKSAGGRVDEQCSKLYLPEVSLCSKSVVWRSQLLAST